MKVKNAATNNQKQRMNIQLNQIRSILTDFRKIKFKCIDISKLMGEQMPKQVQFKNIEKGTLRKMDLLDLPGLVSLKNQLVKALTELFDIQRQLLYKKQKYDAKRQIMQQQAFHFSNKFTSEMNSPRNVKPLMQQQQFKSIISQPKAQKIQTSSPVKPKNKGLQIPLYRAKTQTNQNKLDRISKYVAALKKNMKINTESIGYKWKIKQFLMEDQNFISIRTQIEKYQMREQELDYIISKQIQKGVRSFLGKAEIIQGTPTYKIIKVYKEQQNNNSQKGRQSINVQKSSLINQTDQSSLNYSGNKQIVSPKKFNSQNQTFSLSSLLNSPKPSQLSKLNVEDKVSQDFNSIKKQLEKSSQNYAQMLSKINQTVQKGSQKLIQLRQKRKKKFQKDDDIWGELDKI